MANSHKSLVCTFFKVSNDCSSKVECKLCNKQISKGKDEKTHNTSNI